MKPFRISLINLLWLYLMFSEDNSGCCLDTVRQPPRSSISHLQAASDRQSLMVSWLINHDGLEGTVNEIQISRTENHTVIYSKNVSIPSADSDEYTWTWTSDLPLECADHSVRIRRFYNQSVSSPWSKWVTNYGVEVTETKIFPFQRVLREGSSAMFCCVPPVGVNITNITFMNMEYPLINIGARVKAIVVDNLTIPPPTIRPALLLGCGDTTNKMSHIWNYVSFPAQKPRNLTCVTSHMTTVTCTWDPGRNRYPYDSNKQTHTLHIENSDQAPINCEPTSCTFPAIPQLEEYKISVMVKDQLGEETESYSFNISERVFPVVELYRVSPEVTDTTVSWIIQGYLTQMNLVCQVTIDPDNTTEVNCKSVNGLCKVKLENLLPNTSYSTRVRCSVNGKKWGKWTQPKSFTTYPFVTLNLWRRIERMSDLQSRQVTLLWTLQVPVSGATVNIQGYTIQWSQEGQNRTEWKGSGQTQAEVYIGPSQCNFTVQAVFHKAPSIVDHITIPKLDNRENLPIEKRLSSSIAGGFNLSWAEQDTATCGYTVEWCLMGNTVPCTLQWTKMLEGKNTLFLPASNFKAGCRYTFNIYGCTANEHRLLEIQTGYSQELEAVRPPRLVESPQSTPSSVTLEWHYDEDDPAHPGFITGYLVTVQEAGSNMLPGHTANMFNMSVADPRRKSVTIEGLKQSHEYAFSVRALTKVGPGETASITIRTRYNYSAHLTMILIPILLLLGCTILLWPQRKILKRGLKEIFAYPVGMNIKISELDSFLHETVERVQPHKVEECISCDIEIINTHPPLNHTATLRDPGPLNTPPSPTSLSSFSSLSPFCLPVQDYRPQLVTLLCEGLALPQITHITNKTYFHSKVEDFSEPQEEVTFSEIKSSFEPSDCLQESCSVIYGYVSSDTL
ncbi:oncostatin-M-specific receptor subunit beta isoform X2 [Toxotes jaculatrix]|uniref:oncostatin-M-specific receptor subunit beta isoform X2 n=1 Tax=Toxotes jaculatrix TaxID=941984 RepID=UPI001B3ACBB9|nr:oncostatin-M-specific receptor subunit beta isoform X2 [Toxotes jaculatrix]